MSCLARPTVTNYPVPSEEMHPMFHQLSVDLSFGSGRFYGPTLMEGVLTSNRRLWEL